MAQLSVQTAFETYRRSLFFLSTSLADEPKTAQLAEPVLGLYTKAKASDLALWELDEAVLVGRVKLNRLDLTMGRELRALEATAKSVDSLDPTLHVLSFLFAAKSAAKISRPVGLGIDREISDVRGVLGLVERLPDNPALTPLRERAASLAAVTDKAEAARNALEAAINVRTAAGKDRYHLKLEARKLFAVTKAQLSTIFPQEAALVESFFLPRDESRAPTQSAEEQDDSE
ncbi:MAG: hypothetical protein RBU37_01670 [Myxococcota bacterium]|jgi:hypothetical protein|nr:hypothetical protein [Myxococcota bacterium]